MNKTQRLKNTPPKNNYRPHLLDSTTHRRNSIILDDSPFNSTLKINNITAIKDLLPRKKIFGSKTIKHKHIQFGSNSQNLTFQDLDDSLIPICLFSFRCGCQNSTLPCQRLMRGTTDAVLKQMKTKYTQLKQIVIKSRVDYTHKIQKFTLTLHKNFPQALVPSLQFIIKLQDQLTFQSFSLLSFVFFHTKIDYLAYWMYKQIQKSFKVQHSHVQQSLLVCISVYSKSLTKFFTRNNTSVSEVVDSFCYSYGTSLIPIQCFSVFIQNFNRKGKQYLPRVLLVLLMYLQPNISLDCEIMGCIQSLGGKIPWQRILVGAADKRLY